MQHGMQVQSLANPSNLPDIRSDAVDPSKEQPRKLAGVDISIYASTSICRKQQLCLFAVRLCIAEMCT